MKKRIYLDNNSATPVDPRVIETVVQYLRNNVGNPSSVHTFGKECRKLLTASRDSIAHYLQVRPEEILFNSGGTEGANMILRGLFQNRPQGHIVTSAVEHPCVYQTIQFLESKGMKATYLEPGEWGAVTPDAVKEALRPDTKLIVLMAANNETGVKTDIHEIAKIAYAKRIPFLVDAVALLGKEDFQIPEGVSAMVFSGQKIHALQGSGFCYIKRTLKLDPLITGGTQQTGKRAGTENMPGIVGLAKAIALIIEGQHSHQQQMLTLRDAFESKLKQQIPEILINGLGPRVVNTSNVYFPGIDGETLITALDMEGIAVGHGSACASGALEPSRILLNMGFPVERVHSSIRFSFSRMNTLEEITQAISSIDNILNRLR